jgi:hypothetical protein
MQVIQREAHNSGRAEKGDQEDAGNMRMNVDYSAKEKLAGQSNISQLNLSLYKSMGGIVPMPRRRFEEVDSYDANCLMLNHLLARTRFYGWKILRAFSPLREID